MRTLLVGAHAGARCHAPENTLAAIEKAIELGADRIEFDVRRSRDGHIVLMHDSTADRMTDGTGRIADLTLEELRRLTVAGTEPIPTLSEVLALVKGRSRLLVEIKDEDIADEVVALITDAGMAEACTISSFHEEMLRRVKALCPALATACFLLEPRPFDPADAIARLGVSMLIVWPPAASPEVIAAAKRAGLHVRCSLRDDLTYEETFEVFRRMADVGVDEISSGRPDWMRRMAAEYVRSGRVDLS
jgi:glycerophosphoryl diester phosphodiesterase